MPGPCPSGHPSPHPGPQLPARDLPPAGGRGGAGRRGGAARGASGAFGGGWGGALRCLGPSLLLPPPAAPLAAAKSAPLPSAPQVVVGSAEVLQLFGLKGGRGREGATVAGCRVTDGSIRASGAAYRCVYMCVERGGGGGDGACDDCLRMVGHGAHSSHPHAPPPPRSQGAARRRGGARGTCGISQAPQAGRGGGGQGARWRCPAPTPPKHPPTHTGL